LKQVQISQLEIGLLIYSFFIYCWRLLSLAHSAHRSCADRPAFFISSAAREQMLWRCTHPSGHHIGSAFDVILYLSRHLHIYIRNWYNTSSTKITNYLNYLLPVSDQNKTRHHPV